MADLRHELLVENDGDPVEAAGILALRLTRDDPGTFKVGYSQENAILAAVELFPEVSPDQIRFINQWGISPTTDPQPLTTTQAEALEALVYEYQDYQDWLAEDNKADEPANDEDRADWLYDIADYVGTLVASFPTSYGSKSLPEGKFGPTATHDVGGEPWRADQQ